MKRISAVTVLAIALLAVGTAGVRVQAQTMRTEPLFAGCNSIALTWDAGTPLSTVAERIEGTVLSIFRYDNATRRFYGWAPDAPSSAIDYPAVAARLEPVFICMRSAGQIAQPDPSATSGTPTPLVQTQNIPLPLSPLEYFNRRVALVEEHQRVFGLVDQLSVAQGPRDAEWLRSFSQGLITLKDMNRQMRELAPPACLATSHATLMRATEASDRSADLILEALDLLEDGRLEDGAANIERAGTAISEANQLLAQSLREVSAARC